MGVPAVEGKLVSLLSAIGVTVLAADSFKTATSLNNLSVKVNDPRRRKVA